MLKIITLIIALLVVGLILFVFVARRIGTTVHVEHTFTASAETIWALWNAPEAIKQWWGPKDYSAPVIENDLRVGGRFLLSMKSPKGEMFWNTGSYRAIIPHRKIVSGMSFADEHGKPLSGDAIPVPGVWPDEVTITVEFREMDGKTTVSIMEEGIPLIMKWFAGLGWQQQFDKFETLLQKPR